MFAFPDGAVVDTVAIGKRTGSSTNGSNPARWTAVGIVTFQRAEAAYADFGAP